MLVSILRKCRYWYGKHGFLKLVRFSAHRCYGFLFPGADVLFWMDMDDLSASNSCIPKDVAVEGYSSMDEISEQDMKFLASQKGGDEILQGLLNKFFNRGAVLWLAKIESEVAGYHWSVAGGFDSFYKFPITNREVILISSEVFPEFRGRGVNPAMLHHMLLALKEKGARRAYIACKTWNRANLRSIPKVNFRKMGVVRMVRLFGWYITIWKSSQIYCQDRSVSGKEASGS